uniref:beta-N-acetylhexosaminidase n=1 Tax=Lepeophtheirus salmonis TaxID=72036 RepID=A0A0K2TV29_LEPSM
MMVMVRSRFWRKKSVLLGILILAILLLCVHLSYIRSNTQEISPNEASPKHRKFKAYPAIPDNYPNPPRHSIKKNKKVHRLDDLEVEEDTFEGARFLNKKNSAHKLALSESEKLFLKDRSMDLLIKKEKLDNRKVASRYRNLPPQISPMNSNLEYDIPPPVYYGSMKKNSNGGERSEGEVTSQNSAPYVPAHRLVHLDLKGAPPSIHFLLKVLQTSKELGATGVLLEYEDMFPFEGRLQVTSASNHYTKDDLKAILSTCTSLGFIVIPLIQTFGHMEFILKLKEFAYLRDVADMPESICPCHEDAMGLLKEMVDQVSNFHKEHDPNFQYIHIGCDEVFHLGECEPCSNMRISGRRNEIFTQHVVNIASYIKNKFSVMPIIWDDMLRNFMSDEMTPLSHLVEPMVWVYAEDVYRFVPTYTWDKLAEVFDTVWTASAFKGAHGSTLVVPNIKRHLENNLNWLDVMKNEENKFKTDLRGIVLTGWQRYDHFAILCELLPGGIPSLAVNLLATSNGYFNGSLTAKLNKVLQCSSSLPHSMRNSDSRDPNELDLVNDPYLFNQMSWCFFTGSTFFKTLQSLLSTKKDVEAFIKKVKEEHAWTTDYSMRRNYTSPYRIDEVMGDWDRVYYEIERLMKSAKYSLIDIFDVYTQSEWIEQNIYPQYLKMKEIKEKAKALRKRTVWERRPLPPLKVLETEFGVGLKRKNSSRIQPIEGEDIGISSGRRYNSGVTGRPKRLVQQPDYYRHPPGY